MSNMPTLRDILNGDPADATDVEWNFNTIETHIDQELINRDGTVNMAAALNLVSGAPTLAAHATRKDYVDGLITATETRADSLSVFTRTTDITFGAAFENVDIEWEAETVDNDAWGTAPTTNLTCPATGLYFVQASGTSTGAGVQLEWASVSGTVVQLGVSHYYMTSGHVFKWRAYSTSEPTGTLTSATLAIARLR
jgi:hypothetical protein